MNVDALRRHMARSPREKLQWLQEINAFFDKAMPERSKRIWEELKRRGW